MDLEKIIEKIYNGVLEVAKNYLLLLIAILVLAGLFVAGQLGLDLVEQGLDIAKELINYAKNVI